MQLRIWGSTGSISSPGPNNVRFGGHTSCVEVRSNSGHRVLLDAGTGAREAVPVFAGDDPVHIVFTHLHVDHVFGLGFFGPVYQPGREVHLWGPAGPEASFKEQLRSFFSLPLFPVELEMMACNLHVHDLPARGFELPGFQLETCVVAHPGPTVAVKVSADDRSLTYVPDHEPGFAHLERQDDEPARALCSNVDLLLHDAMYFDDHYEGTRGFGHCSVELFCEFIRSLDNPGIVVPFHQEPGYSDDERDLLIRQVRERLPDIEVREPHEGAVFEV